MSAGTLPIFSIRTKLLVFVASILLVPGAIGGAIAISSSRAALARLVGRQLTGETRNAADRLATVLRSHRENLASYARQDVMREIRIGDLDKRISSFLTSVRAGCASCLDLVALDRTGRVVAASDAARIGTRIDRIPAEGRAGGAIAGPFASSYERPILQFFHVIPDPDAPTEALGTLVALVDWDGATETLAGVPDNLAGAGVNADVLVLDAAARVIGGAPRQNGTWRRGDVVAFALGASADDARIAPDAGVIYGTRTLPDDLPRWTILVTAPLAEAFAPVTHMARLLAGVLSATLLGALLVAVVAARRATRPLTELTAAAHQMGRGATIPFLPVRTGDEIGTLTAAFNRMAEDLSRAEHRLVEAAKFAFVGELAAGVAHEVRTPLGVLRSSTQLLARSLVDLDDESRELLQIMRDEVDRVERVVSGLLDLGRPHALRLEIAPLGAIVLRAADFVEAQARAAGIAIRRHPITPDPSGRCDPELVYQVALNLLVNAVQMLTRDHAIDVVILPSAASHAGFEVRDDGPGIPVELRARLFEPFVTGREGGCGLGLTFVQRVVLEHHGRVVVEDNPGGGAVFRVELPTAEAET